VAGVRLSIGVHPHARGSSPTIRRAPRVWSSTDRGSRRRRAFGEIGLDYHYDFSPRDVQQAVFREQIQAARRLSCRS
jgi:TatD DNase family protein